MKEPKGAQLHSVKFYNINPRAINYLTHNKKLGLLALCRNDSSIEIWNVLNDIPVLIKRLMPRTMAAIESCSWVNDRLFSTNSDGEVTEWDLHSLEPKKSMRVTGNIATCIDTNHTATHIAVGTEEGYLNIFNVADGEFLYEKILDRQEGRIVCVCYDHTDKFIVTGSTDFVRVWSLENGHAIHKMSTGRSEARRETIVWAAHVLKDFTIVTGDSRGKLVFWDGKVGMQQETINVSKADILSIAVREDETKIFCAGVEPIIRQYTRTNVKERRQYVRDINRRCHTHDVLALCLVGRRLFSGGLDGYLMVTSHPPRILNKYGPFLPAPCAVVAEDLLLLKYANYLEVWRTGNADEDRFEQNVYALKSCPEKLLELRAKNDLSIVCAAFSVHWIFYSTVQVTKLFYFESPLGQKPQLTPLPNVPETLSDVIQAAIAPDEKLLYAVLPSGILSVFTLKPDAVELKTSIRFDENLKETVSMLRISPCGGFILLASSAGEIIVWKKSGKLHAKLPRYDAPPTAVEFRPGSRVQVAVVFADLKFFEYDLTKMEFVYSTTVMPPEGTQFHPIESIRFDTRREDSVILSNDGAIFSLLPTDDDEVKDLKQVKKSKKLTLKRASVEMMTKLVKKADHLVHLDCLGEGKLLVVEVNPLHLIEQLPSALRQKKFGIS